MATQHVIPQDSEVILYQDVDISSKYNRQVVHQSKAEQTAYFARRGTLTYSHVSVLRNTRNSIKVEARQGTLDKYTYMSFRNPNLDNRTYYAFIQNIDYLNNDTCVITYEIDYFQTYYLDATFTDTQIVREHMSVNEYNKAMANPFDRSLISLHTPEDLVPDPEMYTLLGGDSADKDSTGSKWLPSAIHYADGSKGDDKVIVMFVAPFNELSGSDRKEKALYVSKYGTLSKEEAWKQIKAAKKEDYDDDDGIQDGKVGLPGLIHAGLDNAFNNIKTGLSTGKWAGSLFDANLGYDSFSADYDREKRKEEEAKAKHTDNANEKYKRGWEDFLRRFSAYHIEGEENGGFRATRMFVFKGRTGYKDFQAAVDYMTLLGYSSSIVGAYYVPLAIVSNTKILQQITNPCRSRHPKLHTFPYTYINVIAPDGTNKEYKFENFAKVTDGTEGSANFTLTSNFNGVPTMSLVPLNYKMTGSADDVRTMYNYQERIVYKAFPPVGWTTDSYLSYLNQQNTAFAMTLTPDQQKQRQIATGGNILRNVGAGVAGFAMGGLPGALASVGLSMSQSAPGLISQMTQDNFNRDLNNKVAGMGVEDANTAAGGYLSPEWQATRQAFVNRSYEASGADGWEMYQYWGANFRIDVHTIHPEYLATFERYFDLLGYATKRIGTPHLISWIRKSGVEPKWAEVDGHQISFLKTHNIQITGVIAPAIDAISSLLDGGCTFVKGN